MRNQANVGRTDVQFKEGDWVLLKLQPYRHTSLARRISHKLARRFYGPFQVVERVGEVAYRLNLPATAKLHNVFHVSRLKKFVGDPGPIQTPLPAEFLNQQPILEPHCILNRRNVLKRGRVFSEILVQWTGQSEVDATWEDLVAFKEAFLSFILEDKDLSKGGAIVAKGSGVCVGDSMANGDMNHRRSSRQIQGRKHSKYKDYIMN